MGMTQTFKVKLDQFEGPLDLLLYLIQSQELDISTVSISKITDQYLNALKLAIELNFDLASEFLVMAATLIMWKSKAILPNEEDENQNALEELSLPLTQEELVQQLLNRQRFLAAAGELAHRPFYGDDVFSRPNKRPPVEKIWKEMKPASLATTLQDLLIREQRRGRVIMKKETVSLATKIQEFGKRLQLHQITEMKSLVTDTSTRGEWVVTFLASLELSRLKKLKVYQEKTFDPIFVELIDAMLNFDLNLASGFDYSPQQASSQQTPPMQNNTESTTGATL